MRLRTSCFDALRQIIRRSAPVCLLYSMASDLTDLEKSIQLGGKNYAVKEILL